MYKTCIYFSIIPQIYWVLMILNLFMNEENNQNSHPCERGVLRDGMCEATFHNHF